jgi:hypothetical protein
MAGDDAQPRTPTKERSPNFPFISLGRALERAQQLYKHEKRGAAPFKVVAEHWGYSPSSSGALQTAGALKQYGLLADEDGGKERKLRLTEIALRILIDTREDSTERDQLKRQAALMPPVAAEVYKLYPDALPSDATLHHYLALERGFNPDTAMRVIRILKENEGVARFASEATASAAERTEKDSPSPADVSEGRARVADALVERQMYPQRVASKAIGSFQHGGVTLTILADGQVTQETLTKLTKFIELIKDGFPKGDWARDDQPIGVLRGQT